MTFCMFSGCLQVRPGVAKRYWMGSYWFHGSWESQESWRNPEWKEVSPTSGPVKIHQCDRFFGHGLSQAKCGDNEQGEVGFWVSVCLSKSLVLLTNKSSRGGNYGVRRDTVIVDVEKINQPLLRKPLISGLCLNWTLNKNVLEKK